MILDAIVARKREEVAAARGRLPERELQARLRSAPAPRDFGAALRRPGEVSIIAEFKRRSPSAVAEASEADPVDRARRYEAGGAAALSVLTDGPFFGGSAGDLAAVREATTLPVLRKEFIVDRYQLAESRALGADAVLLIARILPIASLAALLEEAEALGLAALVEIHHERERDAALDAGARLIGINNRDLADFSTSIEVTARLRPSIPADRIVVSESGITRRDDVALLERLRVDAALIGRHLMRAEDPARAILTLRDKETQS